MNILNTIQSALGGGDNKDDFMSSDMGLLSGQGGLQNLISQFDTKGLGYVVSFEVRTEEDKSISVDQIQNVLGSAALSGITSKLVLNVNDLSV